MHIQTNTFISDALLIQALKVGATDVHLSPSNAGYCVYYRITGVMTFVQRISIEESKSFRITLNTLLEWTLVNEGTHKVRHLNTSGMKRPLQ